MAARGTARGAHALWVLVKPSSKAISAVARLFLQQRLELWRQRGRRVSPAGSASMAAESRGQDSTSIYTMSTGPSSRRAPICSTGITLRSQVTRCTGVITHGMQPRTAGGKQAATAHHAMTTRMSQNAVPSGFLVTGGGSNPWALSGGLPGAPQQHHMA